MGRTSRNDASIRFGMRIHRKHTAHQATLTTANKVKRMQFLELPYPYGRFGIPVGEWIDFDEAGIYLMSCNRLYSKCFVGNNLPEAMNYNKSIKYTLICAISTLGYRRFLVTDRFGCPRLPTLLCSLWLLNAQNIISIEICICN
mmetsp:Transcript_15096/g.25021  ORF Transcript_15096/g.25021 Transcript_15096/m.25021 type:complete len:144 (-) Transcript_15096:258-689(-)